MRHLIVCREYPPAPYAPGGIGTYAHNIARLLAEAGEIVHVIGQRWDGAPLAREESCGGRLVVHRIAPGDVFDSATAAAARRRAEIEALRQSPFPAQWFSLQAALLAERLVEEEGIDVIEGQEWEAPLYYFLLRRALGLGPRRRPPCFVHLHSPTEFIVHFNGWDLSSPAFMTMKRMEDYCIQAADALLCPSDFLARQCEARYRLPDGSVHVIPLPLGRASFIERDRATWERGSICYVGRLEARKGVIEWVDAAVQVASEIPSVVFDFIGSDMQTRPGDAGVSMRQYLEARIPRALRDRFRFHGPVPREQLSRFLAQACAAVVPSRWENFPNTCVEAMGSGVPVIATCFGAMAGMVEDGVSGWLAEGEDLSSMVPGLAGALRRCLESPPERRQAMGAAAAAAIRRMCDNQCTTAAHVAFRARVARGGCRRSGTVPEGGATAQANGARPRDRRGEERRGIGVVAWIAPGADAQPLLDSLRHQSRAPAVLVVAGRQDDVLQTRVNACGGRLLPVAAQDTGEAWNAAVAAVSAVVSPLGWMFLDHDDRLEPDALARLEAALAAAPGVGLVSCWTGHAERPGQVCVCPNPGLPHQWVTNEVARATVFRAEALPAAAPFGADPVRGAELWELALSVLVGGWAAVTYPATLAWRARDDIRLQWPEAVAFRERRGELMRRFPTALVAETAALIDLYVPAPVEPMHPPGLQRPGREPVNRVRRLLRRPRRLLGALRRRLSRPAASVPLVVQDRKEAP